MKDDLISGREGDDYIRALAGEDLLRGGAGDDVVAPTTRSTLEGAPTA